MRTYIYTISQSTNNQHLWAHLVQFSDELTAYVFSITCYLASTNYAYNLLLIKVGITYVIKHQRCISTLQQSLRVVIVEQRHGTYFVLFHVFHFNFCPFHRVAPVLERINQSWCASFYYVAHFIAVLI